MVPKREVREGRILDGRSGGLTADEATYGPLGVNRHGAREGPLTPAR